MSSAGGRRLAVCELAKLACSCCQHQCALSAQLPCSVESARQHMLSLDLHGIRGEDGLRDGLQGPLSPLSQGQGQGPGTFARPHKLVRCTLHAACCLLLAAG